MKQTPITETHNEELFRLIPASSMNLIEIGCGSGALAREVKKTNPSCHYTGIDIEKDCCALAERYCDVVMNFNIEEKTDSFYENNRDRDCWIFGDTLEHLTNPWDVLCNIRKVIPLSGVVVASIPNFQHWSIFARLSVGDFRYGESGLLDKTHLRWFTKDTIFELFSDCGFNVQEIQPRIFHEELITKYSSLINLIGEMASICGHDSEQSIKNSLPFQYVVRAVPV